MKPAFWRRLKKRADVNVAIAIFSLGLVAMVWAAVVSDSRSERDEAIATAIKQNANLAVAYEEHVIRTLKGFDAVTLFASYEYERLGRQLNLAKYLSDGIIDAGVFGLLSVTDERGQIVLSSNEVPKVGYADREHFKAHALSNTNALYISKPVFGRISNTWQIPMTRRINKPDGSFGGVVVLSVNPGYFTAFYQKADLGAQGLVALVGLDGVARARRVGHELSFGDDMSDSSLLKEQARSPAGSFFTPGGIDGVPRYVSYRTLADYPLIVAVGAAQEDVLAEYQQHRIRDYSIAAVVSTIIAIFAALLIVAVARQKRAAAALAEDIVERKRLEADLRELAATDMLTELPNRRHFLARLEEEHARLQRIDTLHASVLMLDLDYFKKVNDTYGHAAGDAVLRHFAALIRAEVRQIDTASRVGGEEFAIILPGATHTAALEFAERLRRKVADSPTRHEDATIRVTVSIGVAAMNGADERADAALGRADAALYRAKEGGRNRVEVVLGTNEAKGKSSISRRK